MSRKRRRKVCYKNEYITRNITPDIFKVLGVIFIIFLGYCLIYRINYGMLPYVNGVSIRVATEDYDDLGINDKDIVVLSEKNKSKGYLVRRPSGDIVFSTLDAYGEVLGYVDKVIDLSNLGIKNRAVNTANNFIHKEGW